MRLEDSLLAGAGVGVGVAAALPSATRLSITVTPGLVKLGNNVAK